MRGPPAEGRWGGGGGVEGTRRGFTTRREGEPEVCCRCRRLCGRSGLRTHRSARGRDVPKGSSEVKRLALLSGGVRIDFTLRAASSPAARRRGSSLMRDPGGRPDYRLPAILNPANQEQLLFPLNADIDPSENMSILRKKGGPAQSGWWGSEVWNDLPRPCCIREHGVAPDLKYLIKIMCY